MFNNKSQSIKKSNCNGILIETEKCWHRQSAGGAWWEVTLMDQYDDWSEPEVFEESSEADALARHDALVEEYKDKPNWNAQAAYDEAHGTVNGEDEMIWLQRQMAN